MARKPANPIHNNFFIAISCGCHDNVTCLDASDYLYFNDMMILIGLGSNLGDRHAMLEAAISKLAPLFGGCLRASSRIETPALLLPDSPPEWDIPFINMAARADDSPHEPLALLAELKRIERELGRTSRGCWAPREIDLDILCYHDVVMSTPTLTLPHPELLNRHFALAPFAEIAPDVMINGKRAADWFSERFA